MSACVRIFALLCFASCTSVASVKRVTPGADAEPGLRYYLPQPFLVVTPQDDGKIEAHWEFLADQSQEYAVDAWSFLGNHKLEMKTLHGLLASVDWAGGSDAVAAEAVKAAGEVSKQRIDSEIEAKKAEQADLKELRKAYDQAMLELTVAGAEYRASVAAYGEKDPKTILAKAKLEASRQKVAYYAGLLGIREFDALDQAKTDAEPAAGDASRTSPVKTGKRHGPVWFRLDAGGGMLRLVAVDFPRSVNPSQGLFDVYSVAKKPTPPASEPKPKRVEFAKDEFSIPQSGIDKPLSVELKTEIKSVNTWVLQGPSGVIPDGIRELKRENSKLLSLRLKADVAAGQYQVSFNAKLLDDTEVKGLFKVEVVGGQ